VERGVNERLRLETAAAACLLFWAERKILRLGAHVGLKRGP
jgi:hypothetical protein